MKVTQLTIKNVGMVEDVQIKIDKPLILFYGDIMQGKTTILNAIKFAFGGSFPSDIIRHGQTEAMVLIEFDGGSIQREWYVGRDGQTKSREIQFVLDGKVQTSPATRIKEFLNPFLLDQDYLRKMTETERKAYFVQFFGADTSEIDAFVFKCEQKARELRAKVKGYGDIDLTHYEAIDVSVLANERTAILTKYDQDVAFIDGENGKIRAYNSSIDSSLIRLTAVKETIASLRDQINELNRKMYEAEQLQAKGEAWLEKNPRRTEVAKPTPPDTSVLDRRINEAAAHEVRVEQYQRNLKRADEKVVDERNVSTLEEAIREKKREKIKKLADVTRSSKINDLVFSDDGTFSYMGTQAGMLSTSQIMKLSSELSGLYPEGFGLDLIDRAESLGKSIFLFVAKAEEEHKTILATIVGERPAEVPENIGVFVVENGRVMS